MKKSILLHALAITLTLVCSLPVLAQSCAQTSASQADQDLWNFHGCWRDFYLWQYQAYDMTSGDWSGRGWDDACNVDKEYPKHWSASYLLTYGLADNNSFSFHGTADYRGTAERPDNNYHHAIRHTPLDDNGFFGKWIPEVFGPNLVQTSCPLYDPAVAPNANPASRAGDFMHEGWHGWMDRWGWNNGSCGGHRCGPTGACTWSSCDYFYFHGIGAYAFGAMWQNDGTANRFHSPNQVQVEFLCDVAEYPQGWVPASVRQAARVDANQRADQRFINGPGFHCGDPRPW
jgi:hypothetical protein